MTPDDRYDRRPLLGVSKIYWRGLTNRNNVSHYDERVKRMLRKLLGVGGGPYHFTFWTRESLR